MADPKPAPEPSRRRLARKSALPFGSGRLSLPRLYQIYLFLGAAGIVLAVFVFTNLLGPGLAWDAAATAQRQVPSAPTTLSGLTDVVPTSTAGAIGGQVLSALLIGVSPLDPVALTGAAAVCIVVAVVASWVPVHRAMRVAASDALRSE